MAEREAPRQLSDFVQIDDQRDHRKSLFGTTEGSPAEKSPRDDAYLGGERNGGKPGRGSENKQAFLIAVETDDQRKSPRDETLEHPAHAVIEPVRRFGNDSWHAPNNVHD